MTVTQRLMKPGSFRAQLSATCPDSVARAVDVFDHLVVTPVRLEPLSVYSDANLLASAIYTGVITSKPSPRLMQGADLSWWLGTPNGLGDLLDTAVTRTTGTLSQWITDLVPSSLTVGTVTNTGTSTLTNSYQWVTRREAIVAVCRSTGAEWKISPAGAVDAAAPAVLFTNTPTVVVTRREEGYSAALQGIQATVLVVGRDVEQYTTKVIAAVKTDAGAVPTGSATGSTTYKDLRNNTVVLERLVNAPTEPTANANNIAAAVLGKFNTVRQELSLGSNTYTVSRFVTPGDWVWVWDPVAGITDATNQITWRGETITPQKLRVFALTWPLERGMGVYARRSGSTPTWTDLTDWVDWEDDADVFWEVGTSSRPITDTDATEGGVATLGANVGVAERNASP